MASAFSHIAVPIAIRMAAGKKAVPWRLLLFSFFASIAPDLDSIAFKFGIPYESQWGHRGFTHSIFFAVIFAIIPAMYYRFFRTSRLAVYLTSFFSMISHGILDACTTGGLGVAFLWPYNSERYFFPWKVIEVSPISVRRFFSEKGISVLSSELYYVWMPCLVFGAIVFLVRRAQKKYSIK